MNSTLPRRSDLSDFLRTRRAKIVPSDVGLADGARRRTPGLRREEVALLANIGATWYTRLEQGQPINVSAEVLDGIARALRLTSEERRHLHLLAGMAPAVAVPDEERVSELVRRVLDGLDPLPAYVRGRRWDILAWNASADALADFSSATGPARNIVWRLFRDPHSRCRYGDPECTMRRARRAVPRRRGEVSERSRLRRTDRRPAHEFRGVPSLVGRARRAGIDRRPQALQPPRAWGVHLGSHDLRAPGRRRHQDAGADRSAGV